MKSIHSFKMTTGNIRPKPVRIDPVELIGKKLSSKTSKKNQKKSSRRSRSKSQKGKPERSRRRSKSKSKKGKQRRSRSKSKQRKTKAKRKFIPPIYKPIHLNRSIRAPPKSEQGNRVDYDSAISTRLSPYFGQTTDNRPGKVIKGDAIRQFEYLKKRIGKDSPLQEVLSENILVRS